MAEPLKLRQNEPQKRLLHLKLD